MITSPSLDKFINWVIYNGDQKPSDSISDARWRAMYKHIKREYDGGDDVYNPTQCDGCNIGLPVNSSNIHFDPFKTGFERLHMVCTNTRKRL